MYTNFGNSQFLYLLSLLVVNVTLPTRCGLHVGRFSYQRDRFDLDTDHHFDTQILSSESTYTDGRLMCLRHFTERPSYVGINLPSYTLNVKNKKSHH